METWIEKEFQDVGFGDARLNNRFRLILEAFDNTPGTSIPQTFKTWGEIKACYNFFSNSSVTEDKILEPHIAATLERIKKENVILLLNDTTSLDYTKNKSVRGLGRLASNQNGDNMGIFVHPLIAITADRLCLGIVQANLFTRSVERLTASRAEKKKRPIEEKEIFRWIEGYNAACAVAKETSDTQIIYISDREGDFIDLFHHASKNKDFEAELIVRCSQQERAIDEKEDDSQRYKKINSCLKESPTLGEIKFIISQTGDRKKREVTQSIKARTVVFRQSRINGKLIEKIKINVVMAIEENPPEGEEALCWILLTTLPIETFDQAALVIQHYLCRWEIEIFFKILKSGCKIEERQLETTERLLPMIALFLIISWRVLYLIKIGRANPDLPCTDIFENAEWMSVHRILFRDQAIPEKAPTLGIFIKMIAKLGGHIGRNNDDPPGPKVMWKGLARMSDFTLAWESFGPSELKGGDNPPQKKQGVLNKSPQKGKKKHAKGTL